MTKAGFPYKKRLLFHVILISLSTLLVYSNTLNVPFQFDDSEYVLNNPALRSLALIIEPSGADPQSLPLNVQKSLKTRQAVYLSLYLNYALGGLDVRGYHAFNLFVHLLNASLVYFLVLLATSSPFFKEKLTPLAEKEHYLALFSSLLFALHPLQSQAVTYVAQRFTSVSAFFYLLSIVLYALARTLPPRPEKKKISWRPIACYVLCLLSAVAAMKSKETAFTLPLAITLYEFSFLKAEQGLRRRLSLLLPFYLVALIIPLSLIDFNKPLLEALFDASRTTQSPRSIYLFTQFRVIPTYARLLFLPINQSLDYDYPIFHSFLSFEVLLSFVFIAVCLGASAYLFVRSRSVKSNINRPGLRLVAFGIMWAFLTLSVESSIIPLGDMIFEHRLYLPMAGLSVALAAGVFLIACRAVPKKPFMAAASVLIALVAVFAFMTFQRNTVWRDGQTLWADVVSKSPQKARGHYNLGLSLKRAGNDNEAEASFLMAIRLKRDYFDAYNNLGNIYFTKGLYKKSRLNYLNALKFKPDYAQVHNNLGILYQVQGLHREAKQHYQEAIRLMPFLADAHYGLGLSLFYEGDLSGAKKEFELALSLNPSDAEARSMLERIGQPSSKQ